MRSRNMMMHYFDNLQYYLVRIDFDSQEVNFMQNQKGIIILWSPNGSFALIAAKFIHLIGHFREITYSN
jgi:hypothetical protein